MRAPTIAGIPNECTQKIIDLFNDLSYPIEIILFGSRARNIHREGSDIDLAVKAPSFSLNDRDKILEKYEELLFPWKLDLVIYNKIEEPELKKHIDRVGMAIKKQ